MAGKQVRTAGLFHEEARSLSFQTWQKSLCNEWFSTSTHFVEKIVKHKIDFPVHLKDTLTLRAIAVFSRFGVMQVPSKCNYGSCNSATKLECRVSRGWTQYQWTCSTVGHKHMEESVNSYGFLQQVPINSWMPFLHTITLLRLGRNFDEIKTEMQAAYGNIGKNTFTVWRRLYQAQLGLSLGPLDSLMVGGSGIVCVVDETVVGVHPSDGWIGETRTINKKGSVHRRTRSQVSKKLIKKGVLKRLPARTYYTKSQKVQKKSPKLLKKSVTVMKTNIKKKPSSKRVNKKPASNLKNNGRWLWLAIAVGKGSQVFTHPNGLKRVTYRLLPCKEDAQKNEPRGLLEIKDTLHARVRPKSMLVYDGWTSTNAAVKQLGFQHAPPVVHEKAYRDNATGFHTNDAESENNRVKSWSRHRYGHLNIDAAEMDEYIFYINVGKENDAMMKGLAVSNGAVLKNKLI